jgi:hypothetical protein
MVGGWTPTNIDIEQQDIDDLIGIPGLTAVLRQRLPAQSFARFNIFHTTMGAVPDGLDLYVFGVWFEVFDEAWFLELYNRNPQAQFLILTDRAPYDLERDRVTVIQIYHWKHFLGPTKQHTIVPMQDRHIRISSLSGRITQFRFFVTAKLLDNPNALVHWNTPMHEHSFITNPANWPHRDSLLPQARERLSRTVNPETFFNDPESNLAQYLTHPAYTDSIANSINETKDVSWMADFGETPAPYLTEKTWKCLLSGTAVLFSGQRGIIQTLESLGFEFHYAWSNDYARQTGDLARLDGLLNTIDTIMSMDIDQLRSGATASAQHNHARATGTEILSHIDSLNQDCLDKIEDYFT